MGSGLYLTGAFPLGLALGAPGGSVPGQAEGYDRGTYHGSSTFDDLTMFVSGVCHCDMTSPTKTQRSSEGQALYVPSYPTSVSGGRLSDPKVDATGMSV